MNIRIAVPVLMHGSVQWLRDQIVPVPDELGEALIARGEAHAMPQAEQAVMPRPTPAAPVRPKPAGRPKPETRRSR